MPAERPPSTVSGLFHPTWRRGLFALALAVVGFLLPQEVPLEWYPLNNPGQDINYLEITCAANITNETQLFLDYGRGFTDLDSIRIPISPSNQAYTYTFPLQDAPLKALRVNPFRAPGELLITNFRLINRRGEEQCHFNRTDFALSHEIDAVQPVPNGWKLVTTKGATEPFSLVNLPAPIVPVGMNHRNLLRCLLSTGYLTGMLLILLLAVLFTFHRPTSWRDFLAHVGFMACLGAMFATVGNRGLIKNSIHSSRFVPPPLASDRWLEIDLVANKPADTQLFWDSGKGLNENESVRISTEPHQGLQTIRLPLPNQALRALRFDPCTTETRIDLQAIRVVDAGKRTRVALPLESLKAVRQIAESKLSDGVLHLHTLPGGEDPITEFTKAAVEQVNQTLVLGK